MEWNLCRRKMWLEWSGVCWCWGKASKQANGLDAKGQRLKLAHSCRLSCLFKGSLAQLHCLSPQLIACYAAPFRWWQHAGHMLLSSGAAVPSEWDEVDGLHTCFLCFPPLENWRVNLIILKLLSPSSFGELGAACLILHKRHALTRAAFMNLTGVCQRSRGRLPAVRARLL